MSTEPLNTSYAVGGHTPRLLVEGDYRGQKYSAGYVATRCGVVGVYVQDDYTSLCFVQDGRTHDRSWTRRLSERRIVTLCNRFVAEIVSQPKEPSHDK